MRRFPDWALVVIGSVMVVGGAIYQIPNYWTKPYDGAWVLMVAGLIPFYILKNRGQAEDNPSAQAGDTSELPVVRDARLEAEKARALEAFYATEEGKIVRECRLRRNGALLDYRPRELPPTARVDMDPAAA